MDLLILGSLILLNGVLAMSELAIVTARKLRLRQWADRGDSAAAVALYLAEHPGSFLSTIQIGITAVGIFAGAFGEATLARELAQILGRFESLVPYAEALAFGLVVIGITYCSLILGELVPKQLALHNPERAARLVAHPLRWLSLAAHPLVRLLSASSEAVLRLLGSRPTREAQVSEEEIRAMLRLGAQLGILEQTEHDLVKNVFRLNDRSVSTFMTPRQEIVYIDLEADEETVRRTIIRGLHTSYPVCRGGLENLLGVVSARDLLSRLLSGEPFDPGAGLHDPVVVPEWITGLEVLETFKRTGSHLCLVTDEYGEILGLVTPHDVLEAIVGGIAPTEQPQWIERGDGSWLVDGMVYVDELKDRLNLRRLPNEEGRDYETLGGLVMAQLGRIPRIADAFEWEGYRFEVVDMDGKRVDRVLITPIAKREAEMTPAE
jgi:putative hemolysin